MSALAKFPLKTLVYCGQYDLECKSRYLMLMKATAASDYYELR